MRGMKLLRYFVQGSLLAVIIACGSGDEVVTDVSDPEACIGNLECSLIANPDGIYSVDDLVAVGYKKSRQFETNTLPMAQVAWYGFFNQRDIEVWVYESHEQALEFGVEPAEVAISRSRGQDLGPIVLARYPAYVVYGNLVMLCQIELATCEALIAEMD